MPWLAPPSKQTRLTPRRRSRPPCRRPKTPTPASKKRCWWPVRTHSIGGPRVRCVVLEPRVGGLDWLPDGRLAVATLVPEIAVRPALAVGPALLIATSFARGCGRSRGVAIGAFGTPAAAAILSGTPLARRASRPPDLDELRLGRLRCLGFGLNDSGP